MMCQIFQLHLHTFFDSSTLSTFHIQRLSSTLLRYFNTCSWILALIAHSVCGLAEKTPSLKPMHCASLGQHSLVSVILNRNVEYSTVHFSHYGIILILAHFLLQCFVFFIFFYSSGYLVCVISLGRCVTLDSVINVL